MLPALSILRPLNVATPWTALTVVVPDSVAPGAPVPEVMATVTWPVKPVSDAVTRIAGAIALPAGAVPGCTTNVSVVLVMLNALLVAAAKPGAVAASM